MKLQTILFIAWCFKYHVNSETLEIKVPQEDQPTGKYWWGGPQIPPYHIGRQHNEDQPTGKYWWGGPQIPPHHVGRQHIEDQPTGKYWWGGPEIPPYHIGRQQNEDQPTGKYWWGGPQIPPYHVGRQHIEGTADEEPKPEGKWGHCIPCGFRWCCSSG